ncbi:MAG: hypothetical protein EA415_01345 [Sphaerobacteraceae bacterium]|nr:MAG: hypothetical protein EA415_01345 [Sphaerobacteraceae bacterium]
MIGSYRIAKDGASVSTLGWTMAVLVAAGVCTAAAATSNDRLVEERFFEDRERGWHWYELMPVEEEESEEAVETEQATEQPQPESGEPAGPAPMSAEWIRQELPRLRDRAIDSPTERNVQAYFYAQRIMMDKAQVFSNMAQRVTTSDPLLDENLRLPFASAARAATLASAAEAKTGIVEELSEKAGLWVFFDETCEFCRQQLQPINRFAERHSMEMRIISRQGRQIAGVNRRVRVLPDTGQFENLGIDFTPAVMLVVPPEGFYIVSQGFIDYASLVDRLVGAAGHYGLIEKDKYLAARPTERGVIDASRLDNTETVDWSDSDSWVPFIQREITRVYGIGPTPNGGMR